MPPRPFSALPPSDSYSRLALKLFRGEPAISEFDWNFSAIHTSSPPFSTDVCSDLHEILLTLHPGHGQVTRFRVYIYKLYALFRLGFPSASVLHTLTSLANVTRRTVLQKVRCRALGSPSDCKHRVSGSFSLPSRGSFHLSITVLLLYRSLGSIQPYGVVSAHSHKVSRVSWYSGSCCLMSSFAYGDFTLSVWSFQYHSATLYQ